MGNALGKSLLALKKDAKSIVADLKSTEWKVMLPSLLKQKSSATNVWITQQINMGTPNAVSRDVSEFKQSKGDKTKAFRELTTKVMTCHLFQL